MKINTKIQYGLQTMIELALNTGKPGLLQKEIARRQKIPVKYLDKIVSGLKSADLIINTAGKKSGYVLKREASKINVYDIYRAFEGNLAIVNCLKEHYSCCENEQCASKEFWTEMNREIKALLIHKTLDRLASRQQEMDARQAKTLDFQI